MRLMAVGECRPGDRAADVIRGRGGRVLAERGEILTEAAIQQFKEVALDVVPVDWPQWEGVSPMWWLPDNMSQPLSEWAAQGAKPLTGELLHRARELADRLVDRFPLRGRRPFEWIPLYRGGNPALVAWVNTMGLTIKLTQALDPKWVEDMALAAVLLGREFDIEGNQVGWPSSDRVMAVAEQVRAMSSLPATTRAALAQHHARWDGSGTPPLKADKIYKGAQILGLAEHLNILLYRTDEPAVPINEALEWVVGGAGLEFSLDLVKMLQRTVAPYPVGTVVQLGDGDLGVVMENPLDWPARPMVRMLNGQYQDQQIQLKAPDQLVRVITGFYNGRDLPS